MGTSEDRRAAALRRIRGGMLPAALLLASVGCSSTALQWNGAAAEDPEPSGAAYLRAYKEAHYRELGREIEAHVPTRAVLDEIATTRVLWLGDHHRDPELHARMLVLLDTIRREQPRRRLVFALEAIGIADEEHVADYVDDVISYRELQRRLRSRWNGSWLSHPGMDADFYRALLDLAQHDRVPVHAIEPTPRLALDRRDGIIADRVRRIARRYPDRLVVVVVGHAHLLGDGDLIYRVDLPCVAIGARLSMTLRREWLASRRELPATGGFVRTERGMLFFHPPPEPLPLPPDQVTGSTRVDANRE